MLCANNVQELYRLIEGLDQNAFDIMFRIIDGDVVHRAFVSVFVNETQIFNCAHVFNNGDQVEFVVGIAGG